MLASFINLYLLAALSGFIFVLSLALFVRRRYWRFVLLSITSLSLFSISVAAIMVGSDYSQLLDGDEIAQLRFKKIDRQLYQLELLDVTSGERRNFILVGDQWQLDARVIQIDVIGLNSLYRLDRITGRYLSVKQEKSTVKSLYSLANEGIMPEPWAWLKRCQFCFFREEFGSSTYMPMQDGARFSVAISNQGLLSTPINAQAREAVANW